MEDLQSMHKITPVEIWRRSGNPRLAANPRQDLGFPNRKDETGGGFWVDVALSLPLCRSEIRAGVRARERGKESLYREGEMLVSFFNPRYRRNS